jgi:hypothetical protein
MKQVLKKKSSQIHSKKRKKLFKHLDKLPGKFQPKYKGFSANKSTLTTSVLFISKNKGYRPKIKKYHLRNYIKMTKSK